MTPKEMIGRFENDFNELPKESQQAYWKNMLLTCSKTGQLLSLSGMTAMMTSGWRPAWHNAQVGGAKKSKHLFGQAVDLFDPDKKLGEWAMQNLGLLREVGVYMEALEYVDPIDGKKKGTHANDDPNERWVHFQSIAPKSGNIVFQP